MSDSYRVPPSLVPPTTTQASSAGTPTGAVPPLVGLPVEHVEGRYPALPHGDDRGRLDPYETHEPQLSVQPTPLIGAIPFGGTIVAASFWKPANVGERLTIGDTGNGKPQNTAIVLWTPSATLAFETVADGQPDAPVGSTLPLQVAAGFTQPLTLPLRRMIVRSILAAAPTNILYYLVLGYPVQS